MKPDSFTQIYIHLVFAVKYRECLLKKQHRIALFRYTSGIIENKKCKSIIVNGFSDHIHILLGLNPTIAISDLVRDIKRSTSLFINHEKKWFVGSFAWQEGYGAFSYSYSQIDNIYNYILNQEDHHSKNSYRDEYRNILYKNKIGYNEDYLFKFHD